SRVATPQEYSLIGQYGTVTAKLQSVDPGTGTVSFTIEANHPTLQRRTTGTTTMSRSRRGNSGLTVKIEKEEINFECKVKKDAPLRARPMVKMVVLLPDPDRPAQQPAVAAPKKKN